MPPRASTFRSILQVAAERIASLDDLDLNALMDALLRAQSYRRDGNAAEIRTNVETKAADDGSDGWSPRSAHEDPWLGTLPTCWQFKAGAAGQASRLSGEVSKRIPRETLLNGGRFVVITSGSTNGRAGEQSRVAALRKEADSAGIPSDQIEVIGADRLTRWCNEHPSVAADWAGRPASLTRVADWAKQEVHGTPWKSTPSTDALLQDLRQKLDLHSGTIAHLHIQGPPGVGKTRFTLELCHGAAWKDSVIYFGNAADFRLQEVLHAAVADQAVQLIVVADEVQPEQLTPFRDALDGSGGRIRLITIGHSGSPDPTRIPTQPIAPLPLAQMKEIVSAWHPSMPREYVDFVVQFADGFIRLARLAADAVASDPGFDTAKLLKLSGIRSFMDKMLGTADRKHLYVVATLTLVGWRDEVQIEGEKIAELFGWAWNDVRATIESFDRKYGIVPRGGRYRYISPKPLGVYLAVEAWETFPDLMKRLPDVLPTEGSKRAYSERLQTIASNPQARQFSSEQLQLFFSLEQFTDSLSIARWAAFAAANPSLAARTIRRVLSSQSVERRYEIAGDARRTAVWTLVKLAWIPAAFQDATLALALLAEAENETWNNNATGEFRARFLVDLGGTPVNYIDRLGVIDQIVSTGRTSLLGLAVSALSQVASQHAHRTGIPTLGDEVREPEWRPATGTERLECVKQAIARLKAIGDRADTQLSPDLASAIDNLHMLLRYPQTRPLVLEFYSSLRRSRPKTRERSRRAIESILQSERLYWHELTEEDLKQLEVAAKSFEDSALASRLEQYVGRATLIEAEQPDLGPLARELLTDPSSLAANWAWLTSGDAADAWRLGFTLGEVDDSGSVERLFGAFDQRGPDLRLLSGYVTARSKEGGIDWFDGWIHAEMRRDPQDYHLLFEISARTQATEKSARLVISALRTKDVQPKLVGMLAYGVWSSTDFDVLREVLVTLADTGNEETAITILHQRLRDKPGELEKWDALAIRLVTLPKLIRSNHMVNYFWQKIAEMIAARHVFELASAIFTEQATREQRFMAEYSGAKDVILDLAKTDPSSVWRALEPHLTSKHDALLFTIGFPRDVIDQVPTQHIIDWIAKHPDERGAIVAHLARKNFSTDETLASQILGKFGHYEAIGSSFFSNLIGGIFSGPASSHWETLAHQLLDLSKRTRLPALKRWAEDSATSLFSMAQQEKEREDEDQLGAP